MSQPLPRPRAVFKRMYVSIYPGPDHSFPLNARGPLGTYEVTLYDVGDADDSTAMAMAVNHLLDQRIGPGWEAFETSCELRFHTDNRRPVAAPTLQPGVRSLEDVTIVRRPPGVFEGTPVAVWVSEGIPVAAEHLLDHRGLE